MASKKRPAEESTGPPAKAPRTAGQVPDEYLPPNNVLMVQDVPEAYGVEAMTAIFGRFATFKEYNEVPFRPGLGFVHYETEEGAISAKNATHGIELEGKSIRVTYRRK